MTTQVILNGKEVTSPLAKIMLVFAALLMAALLAAGFIFVLLPLVGIAVTLSAGFIAIITVAILAGLTILIMTTGLLGWLFGPTEIRLERRHKE